tara:strand:+ start:447 stop:587 length:141 start_codon:yes stop_codon:yes gene_type:complete
MNEFELKIRLTKKQPKKRLPISPMKILDGCQLNIKKADRAPITGLK